MTTEELRLINRLHGKNTLQLQALAQANREGKSMIIATQKGNIYTEKAHQQALSKQREEIKEQLKHIPMYRSNLDTTGSTELLISCYQVKDVLDILDNHPNK